MSKDNLFYRQCGLHKQIGEGAYKHQVSYLPERFANVGETVQLKDSDSGTWDDGWKIMWAGSKRPASVVEARERDFTETRRASDI